MKALEIRNGRRFAPNVRMVSSGILSQFALWFRAGMGFGVMLFVAFTTLSALGHGADWIQEAAKQSRYVKHGQGRDLVIPKASHVLPAYVSRPAVVVQKDRDDYRVIREQNRFVTDLAGEVSRTVSRIVR